MSWYFSSRVRLTCKTVRSGPSLPPYGDFICAKLCSCPILTLRTSQLARYFSRHNCSPGWLLPSPKLYHRWRVIKCHVWARKQAHPHAGSSTATTIVASFRTPATNSWTKSCFFPVLLQLDQVYHVFLVPRHSVLPGDLINPRIFLFFLFSLFSYNHSITSTFHFIFAVHFTFYFHSSMCWSSASIQSARVPLCQSPLCINTVRLFKSDRYFPLRDEQSGQLCTLVQFG